MSDSVDHDSFFQSLLPPPTVNLNAETLNLSEIAFGRQLDCSLFFLFYYFAMLHIYRIVEASMRPRT